MISDDRPEPAGIRIPLECPECLLAGADTFLADLHRLPDDEIAMLSCTECGSEFPVFDGIPVLVPEIYSTGVNLPRAEVPAEHFGYDDRPTERVARLVCESSACGPSLDVGCGTGTYSGYYRSDVVLADINFYFVKKAFESYAGPHRCYGVVADARCLPFASGAFPYVFASNVIEHLPGPDVDGTIKGLKRVASDTVQIDVPHDSGPVKIARGFLTRLGVYESESYEDEFLKHHTEFSPRRLREEGFVVSGCIGWVSRKRIPLPALWSVYDAVAWRFPSVAGTLIGVSMRGQRARDRGGRLPAGERPDLPTVSCVIPAYNEERRLRSCIESVRSQEYPQDSIEVVVVDDSSEDGTSALAVELGAKVVENGAHNIERGKSIGVETATGDYILLMDADNTLVGTDWLATAAAALLDHPSAVGAQSAWFDYRPSDPRANRYCALMGINDPFAFYLEKRDKLTWYENCWTIAGEVLEEDCDSYLVRFDLPGMPTIGSQGYLVAREDVVSTGYAPYLFHMEMNMEFIKRGQDRFLMMKNTVGHDHCSTSRELLGKLRRNFTLFLEQREIRAYRWETGTREKAVALISMVTIARPLIDAMKGYRRIKDTAWFLHPVFCLVVPAMYATIYARWRLSRLMSSRRAR